VRAAVAKRHQFARGFPRPRAATEAGAAVAKAARARVPRPSAPAPGGLRPPGGWDAIAARRPRNTPTGTDKPLEPEAGRACRGGRGRGAGCTSARRWAGGRQRGPGREPRQATRPPGQRASRQRPPAQRAAEGRSRAPGPRGDPPRWRNRRPLGGRAPFRAAAAAQPP